MSADQRRQAMGAADSLGGLDTLHKSDKKKLKKLGKKKRSHLGDSGAAGLTPGQL